MLSTQYMNNYKLQMIQQEFAFHKSVKNKKLNQRSKPKCISHDFEREWKRQATKDVNQTGEEK